MVKLKSIRDLLAENPFFEGMGGHHIEFISGCGEIVNFEEGAFLSREGEYANNFYLILKGEVAVESYVPAKGAMMISRIKEGGISGYSWLFLPYRSQFDTRALTKVKAIQLNGKCLRGKAESDHELGYKLMNKFTQMILQRMQDTRRQMLDIYVTEKKVEPSDQ